MIKKMRYQFILVTMASISFIFILILTVINISMTLSSRRQGYELLWHIARMPENQTPPTPEQNSTPDAHPHNPVGGFDSYRSFSVTYDSNGNITEIVYNKDFDLTEASIRTLAMDVLTHRNASNEGISSKYLYIIKEKESGMQIFFLDYSLEKNISLRLFWTCLYIGLIGILFLFVLVVFLSKWIVKPVQTAFLKQKQFITDASHELKTPLTIITANAEVLAATLHENKWVSHILSQTTRMNLLIKNLLELARLDNCDAALNFADFNISKAITNTALSFESLAYEYGKTYHIDVTEGIYMYGNENAVKQLLTILLDNAFKYSDPHGTITVSLRQHGDKRIINVKNTGNPIPKEEQKRIFERFYRSDTSRSRETGGYGLGLSIASSIAAAHKGHITVSNDSTSGTCFTITMPTIPKNRRHSL